MTNIPQVPVRDSEYIKDMFRVMWEQDHAFTGYQTIVFYEMVESNGDPVQGIPPSVTPRLVETYRGYTQEPKIEEINSGLMALSDVKLEIYLDSDNEPSSQWRVVVNNVEYFIKSKHTDAHTRCILILSPVSREDMLLR